MSGATGWVDPVLVKMQGVGGWREGGGEPGAPGRAPSCTFRLTGGSYRRNAEATQASGSFAELPMSYPGMGFTSFLVGMALWVVLDRVEELSREIADWRARGVGIPEAAGDRRGNRG